MYLIGAYIKLHFDFQYKNIYNLLISLGFAILSIFSVAVLMFIAKKTGSDYIMQNSIYLSNYESITSMGFAVFLFIYFSRINFSNKFINIIGKSTLGIYLIHDNTLLEYPIWMSFWPNNNYFLNPYLHLFAKIIVIFIVCSMIDIIREYTIGKAVNNWINKNIDAISIKFKKICFWIK